jgi:hypothetical protein
LRKQPCQNTAPENVTDQRPLRNVPQVRAVATPALAVARAKLGEEARDVVATLCEHWAKGGAAGHGQLIDTSTAAGECFRYAQGLAGLRQTYAGAPTES